MFDLTPATLIARVIVLLVAVSVHEYAHAYTAFRMGDTTARDQGRMTLDPRANIYWPGFLIGILIGFAILGSAPVNPYRMRNPRWGMFVAVLAGPISNLLVAAVFALPLRFGLLTPVFRPLGALSSIFPTPAYVVTLMVWLNILLFVFNLLPFYPLDGWTVVYAALPPRMAVWWQRHQQHSMYVLYGLIALSFIGPSLARIVPILGKVDLLSLLIGEPSYRILIFLLGL
ncbi:MAG TPA: site-2 protease family protein [Chloroflexi bacterium]|nr:site-2 protease family protein [Chloroflexota bacterium]